MFIITIVGIMIICSIIIIKGIKKSTAFYKRKKAEKTISNQRLIFLIESITNNKTITEDHKVWLINLIRFAYDSGGMQSAYKVYYRFLDLNQNNNCIYY